CSIGPNETDPTRPHKSLTSSSVFMSSIGTPCFRLSTNDSRLSTDDYRVHAAAPWHFLYFFPLPHGQGSLRPTFGSSRRTVFTAASSPPTRAGLGAERPDAAGAAAAAKAGCCRAAANAEVVSAAGSFSMIGARRG